MSNATLVEIGPLMDETTILFKILYEPKNEFEMRNMYLPKVSKFLFTISLVVKISLI